MRTVCNLRMRLIGWAAIAAWALAAALIVLGLIVDIENLPDELILAAASTLSISYLVSAALKPMETAYLLGHERGFQEGRSRQAPEVVRLCHERAVRRADHDATSTSR